MGDKKSSSITSRWAGIILAIGILLIYWVQAYSPMPLGQILRGDNFLLPIADLSRDTVQVKLVKEYLECGHEVVLEERQITSDQLEDLMEENLGFEVRRQAGSIIMVSQEAALCPIDSRKRYLGTVGDYLAIFRGPADEQGNVERVTQIQIDQLPEEWQAQLREGRFEFSDEVSLLEALDSLDEYQR